jgi:16S rRNA (guanine527-N7)-methyltransferase
MASIICKYYPNLSDRQKSQLDIIGPLYEEWNIKINLISRKDINNLYEHHILHSLSIAKVINFVSGSKIIDIGTGGGFPGLPLAIMFPDCEFILIDSIAKKLKVVEAICKQAGIKNITVKHSRVEDIPGVYDFALARAVARLDTTWQWAYTKISDEQKNELPNGLFYLKGGDISQETPNGVDIKRWELDEFFEEDYYKNKAILLITKKDGHQT